MQYPAKHILIRFTCICALLVFGSTFIYASQREYQREGLQRANNFIATAKNLTGKTKEEVVKEIGMPDSNIVVGSLETWRYRKLFGRYQRRKFFFGHVSFTWEVKLELVFNEGVVQSDTSTRPREVHRKRYDDTH